MNMLFAVGSIAVVVSIIIYISIKSHSAQKRISDIGQDDHLIFFRTSAWLDETNMEWKIPIHGWIYKPQNSAVRKTAFRQLLKSRYDLVADETTEVNFSQRVNLLLSDNERRRTIVIAFAGQTFTLPKSKANGHFSTVLSISSANFSNISAEKVIRFSAITDPDDDRTFTGEIKLVSPTGISYISDIDDTIKVSEVKDKKALFENTFFNQFDATWGMSELYRQLAEENVSFHYVSSSPWHLYTPLLDFVDNYNFPWASFELKYIRLKDKSIFNLFKSGTESKPSQIEPILLRYPKRKFILFGDSGEQDPEVYAALLRKFPQQISKIYIRNVDEQSESNDRFSKLFRGIDPTRWSLFVDPCQLDFKNPPHISVR